MTESMVAAFLLVSHFGLGQAAPEVIAHASDGPKIAAPLLAIDADFTAKFGGRQSFTISGENLVSLRQVGLPQPANCAPPYLQLTTGDWQQPILPLSKIFLFVSGTSGISVSALLKKNRITLLPVSLQSKLSKFR